MGGLLGGGGGSNSYVAPMAAGLRIQTSAYGLCIPIVYGRTRITGNLLWYGEFKQYEHTTDAGGGKGGGGGGTSTTWTYTTSFAIALCEGPIIAVWGGWKDKAVLTPEKIAAKFTTFVGSDPQAPWSHLSAAHSGEDLSYKSLAYMAAANYNLGSMSNLPNHSFEISGLLSQATSGVTKNFTATAPTTGPAKTWTVTSSTDTSNSWLTGVSTIYTKELGSAGHGLKVNDIVQLYTTGTLPAGFALSIDYVVVSVTPNSFSLARVGAMGTTIIPIIPTSAGTGVQTAKKQVYSNVLHSVGHGFTEGQMVNISTTGTLPQGLYSGYDYYVTGVTADDFSLTRSLGKKLKKITYKTAGTGVHSIFSPGDAANPRDVVVDLLTNARYGAGFPSASIGDTNDFSAFCKATGIGINPAYTDQKPTHEIVSDIMEITNSACYFSDGVLKIVPLSDTSVSGNGAVYTAPNTPIYDLTDEDFLPGDDGDIIKITRSSTADAFNHVQVEYMNAANQYNIEVVEAKDQVNIDTYGLRSKDTVTAHAITDTEVARTVAQLILQRTLYIRNKYEFTLSMKYCLLEPSDIVTINDAAMGLAQLPVRITSIEEDDQGTLAFIAEDYPAGVTHAALYPSNYGQGWNVDYDIAPDPVATPAFFEQPVEKAPATGLSVGVAVTGSGDNWGGCEVWGSYDDTSYKFVGKTTSGARYGQTTNTFTSAANQTANVALAGMGGQIIAGSTTDATNLATLCLIDNEYVAYTTATLTAANAYSLNLAQRGAYHTVAAGHNASAPFIRVDDSIVYGTDLDLSMIGETIYFKFLSFNQYGGGIEDIASVPSYSYLVTGVMANLPPSDVTGFTATVLPTGVQLAWGDVTDADLLDYELHIESVWNAATPPLQNIKATQLLLPPKLAGSYTFQNKARDKLKNYSLNAASAVANISAPVMGALTANFVGVNSVITWNTPTFNHAIDHYEVRKGGASWDSAAFVEKSFTTQSVFKVNYGVSGMVWRVKATDIAGNISNEVTVNSNITAPEAPTFSASVIAQGIATIRWTMANLPTLPIDHYEVCTSNSRASAFANIASSNATASYSEAITYGGTKQLFVLAIDSAGNPGAIGATSGSSSINVIDPSVATATATFDKGNVILSWATASGGSLQVDHYDVYSGGANFSDPTVDFLASPKSTTFTHPALWLDDSVANTPWVGAKNYYVVPVDTANNRGAAVMVAATVLAPVMGSITPTFSGSSLTLTWASAQQTLPIDHYEISKAGVFVTSTTSLQYSEELSVVNTWVGDKDFSVVAVDTAGNRSNTTTQAATIVAPGAVVITSQVVDNNVLLYWTLSTGGTLPVATYEIRRGDSWATATVIGTKSGGFTTVFETVSATYTYWVCAIDTAGNYCASPASRAQTVNQPPDYVLQSNLDSRWLGQGTNYVQDSGYLYFPVDPNETWQEHFTTHGWTTIADQQAAGYPLLMQPTVGKAQNLLQWSERFGDAVWVKNNCTVLTNNSAGLDGQTSADTFNRTATGVASISQSHACASAHANKPYAFSVWLKPNSYNTVSLQLKDGASTTISTTGYTLTANVWTRVATAATFGNAPAANVMAFIAATTVGAAGDQFHMWGAQLERVRDKQAGTYAVTSNSCVVTFNAHGRTANQTVFLDCTTGNGVDSTYTITAATTNNFTVAMVTANTSGNVDIYDGPSDYIGTPLGVNHLTYSEDMANAPWSLFTAGNVTVVTATRSFVSPRGDAQPISKLQTLTTGTVQRQVSQGTGNSEASTYMTASIFMREGEVKNSALLVGTRAFNFPGIKCNLTAGTIEGTSTPALIKDYGVIPCGNGWNRYWVAFAAETGNSPTAIIPQLMAANYTNYSGAIGDGYYLWGAQLEDGDYPSSYQRTDALAFSGILTSQATEAYYEEIFDYGATISASKINVTTAGEVVTGNVNTSFMISTANTIGTWTDYNGVSQVYATNFRYAKVRFTVTATDDTSIYRLRSMNVTLDVKQKNDGGTLKCHPAQAFTYALTSNVVTATFIPQVATYVLTSNVVTVNFNNHGRAVGESIYLNFTSGTAVDGNHTILSVAQNTFTVAQTAANTSGGCNLCSHGRSVGEWVSCDFTSGTAPDGDYQITAVTQNATSTFTVAAVAANTSGNLTCDANGTPAKFTVTFTDVSSIVPGVSGTTQLIPLVNFVDVANPTTFYLMLYSNAGVRNAATAYWQAKGV